MCRSCFKLFTYINSFNSEKADKKSLIVPTLQMTKEGTEGKYTASVRKKKTLNVPNYQLPKPL